MRYTKIQKAFFISRPNRFIAQVEINGKIETVHVKNTGRCKELLLSRVPVYLEESDNPKRRTKYDLVAVKKNGNMLINMDSQAPNKVAAEWIKSKKEYFPNIKMLKAEYSLGDSRFDFYVEYEDKECNLHKKLIEVKGCTLEDKGIAMFPDAPTQRGLKHVQELTELYKSGDYECMILIIVQMKGCKYFTPNYATHKEFGEALKKAKASGVDVIAVECNVGEDFLEAEKEIEVRL